MMIILILGFALLGVIQITILVKKKHWRDLMAFCVFFVFSFVVCILQAKGVKLPSPTKGIRAFFGSINLHF